MDNWTHGAASRHTIAPISHTRPSPRSRSYSFPFPLRVGGWVGLSTRLRVWYSTTRPLHAHMTPSPPHMTAPTYDLHMSLDGQSHWDHAIKFARWQHSAMRHRARFAVSDTTSGIAMIFDRNFSFLKFKLFWTVHVYSMYPACGIITYKPIIRVNWLLMWTHDQYKSHPISASIWR